MSNLTTIFYILAAGVSVGGIFIAIGFFKGRIQQNTAAIDTLGEQIKEFATKSNLIEAMEQNNKMLEFMKQRAEEDREKGQGQWRDFHKHIASHAERLSALETHQTTFVNSIIEIKAYFREMEKDIKEILRKLPQ